MLSPFAVLSSEDLAHNISVIKEKASKSKIMAMLKANAYGHGIRSTAIRIDHLVDFIGVARIDEGLALRKVGIKSPICIMQGVYNQEDVMIASCNNFELIVHDWSQLSIFNIDLPRKINIWLKVDTGIGRLGFKIDEITDVYQGLRSMDCIGVITLTSHFACADDIEHPLNQVQIERFAKLANDFPGPKSLCNSAGIFNFPQAHYDVVRPGIALYGISPLRDQIGVELGLKPVMTLFAKIMSVREIPTGTTIGYGARYRATSNLKLATIGIGYGDGYPRCAVDGTLVLIKDNICTMIGRVSMDMITVNISELKGIKCGNLVTLWGKNLPLEMLINTTCNATYDILTSVQLRVKFHWT